MVQVRLRYSREQLQQLALADCLELDRIMQDQDLGVCLRYVNSLGLSYRAFAEILDCHWSNVARWANDETKPERGDIALKIQHVFNHFRLLTEQSPLASVKTDE